MADGFWVFGYGSLMWNPGFPFLESQPATLYGYHRSLCIYSWHHRGTPECPGLVLGLDRGGACKGLAFRIREDDISDVITYLDTREMVTSVYTPINASLRLHVPDANGSPARIRARSYIADRSHIQYAGHLPIAEQARIIRQGHGAGGANIDYLAHTMAHLEELGFRDAPLHRLWAALSS